MVLAVLQGGVVLLVLSHVTWLQTDISTALDAIFFYLHYAVNCVCDVVLATAERLEGGWDREPSERPGPLWIMLDLQVTTEISILFLILLFLVFLEKTGWSVCHYWFTLLPNVLKSNNIWESCQ